MLRRTAANSKGSATNVRRVETETIPLHNGGESSKKGNIARLPLLAFIPYLIIVPLLLCILLLAVNKQPTSSNTNTNTNTNQRGSQAGTPSTPSPTPTPNAFRVTDANAVEVFRTFMLDPPVPEKVPYPKQVQGKTHFSQVGQDEAVDAILQQQREGFFIEVGAYNGISLSNSLFFEKERGWTGMLIEANPRAYRELLAAERKAWTTRACISMSTAVEVGVEILAHGMVGGYGVLRFRGDRFKADQDNIPYVYKVKANCFPLNTMLEAIGIDRVDMFSLDVEGAELSVLQTIDFKRVEIRLFVIEHNGQASQIDAFLVSRGYRKVERIDGVQGMWKASDVIYMLQSEFPNHVH